MKKSARLSNAVHILSLITLNPFGDLSSNRLAKSINTNPAFVRQIMSQLKTANLLVSTSGHPEPKLAKSPSNISLYDVYIAVDNTRLLSVDAHVDPSCGPGQNIQLSLSDYYDEVQKAAEDKMKEIKLSDVIHNYKERLKKHPELSEFES